MTIKRSLRIKITLSCIFRLGLSLTETSLGLCRINLGINQITLFLQILPHFLRNFFVSN